VPTGALTSNLPLSEFDAQGTVDMAESQLTAEAVALRQLGEDGLHPLLLTLDDSHDLLLQPFAVGAGAPGRTVAGGGAFESCADGPAPKKARSALPRNRRRDRSDAASWTYLARDRFRSPLLSLPRIPYALNWKGFSFGSDCARASG
jgi:hypothetical protein